MADCRTLEIAQVVAGGLKAIIDNWEIKLLIDVKDATPIHMYANHAIHLATVDRDVLEDDEIMTNLYREEIIPANATSGDFQAAIELSKTEDEIVAELLRKKKF